MYQKESKFPWNPFQALYELYRSKTKQKPHNKKDDGTNTPMHGLSIIFIKAPGI